MFGFFPHPVLFGVLVMLQLLDWKLKSANRGWKCSFFPPLLTRISAFAAHKAACSTVPLLHTESYLAAITDSARSI